MHDRFNRVALVLMTVSSVIIGVWAGFFPRSFYDSFPGLGRHWVRLDGPYNQHLVRDVGTLNLALAVLTGVAAWKLTLTLVRTAAVASLVNAVPHFIYHLTHLSPYGTSDKVGNVVSLGISVVLPACVALSAWMRPANPQEHRAPDLRGRAGR